MWGRLRDELSGWYKILALSQVRRRARRPGATPRECFSHVHDSAWFWALSEGVRTQPWLRELLPGLPDESLQAQYTGLSGDETLHEGFRAYQLFKRLYQQHVGPLGAAHGVLDFGCGWGRIIRFFLKEVAPDRLWGVDHSEVALAACRDTNRWCRFELIDPHPPTKLSAESFDLIYLFSVFSHLPEDLHLALLAEFRRLLRPGGLLIATTRRRDFIRDCEARRQDPHLGQKPHWHSVSARAFLDANACLSAYDAGQFCYANLGMGGRWSFWGEACIPRAYVLKRWTELFEFCDYIDDRDTCIQSVIIVRKTSRYASRDPETWGRPQ